MPLTNNKRWWSDEFAQSKICKSFGACFECCDFEAIVSDFERFALHVESTTIRNVEELLKSKKGILWHDDPNRHLENIARENLINELLLSLQGMLEK